MPPFAQAEGENTTEKQVSRFSSAQTPSICLLCVSHAAIPLKRPCVSQEEPGRWDAGETPALAWESEGASNPSEFTSGFRPR